MFIHIYLDVYFTIQVLNIWVITGNKCVINLYVVTFSGKILWILFQIKYCFQNLFFLWEYIVSNSMKWWEVIQVIKYLISRLSLFVIIFFNTFEVFFYLFSVECLLMTKLLIELILTEFCFKRKRLLIISLFSD